MSWIYLIVAGLFEVAFTSCMGKVKETTGSEMYWWFTGFLVSMSISMFLLIKATQALPIGTAYAVWTGIGAVGTVLAGILIFKEPATVWRLLFIVTLIGSIIGLKVVLMFAYQGFTKISLVWLDVQLKSSACPPLITQFLNPG